MIAALRALLADESGSSMAEYGLVAASLAGAAIAGYALLQGAQGSTLDATAAGWNALALTPP